MTGPAFDRVVAALERAGRLGKPTTKGYKARCTAAGHEDRNPSMDVDRAPGTVLLRCRSRECDITDICAGLGLRTTDLWDEPLTGKTRRAVNGMTRYHPYHRSSGALIGMETRQPVAAKDDPKFLPLGVNGQGWKCEGSEELASTPYRLPELREAMARGEEVWIPEGGHDVDTLARLGITATPTRSARGSGPNAMPAGLPARTSSSAGTGTWQGRDTPRR